MTKAYNASMQVYLQVTSHMRCLCFFTLYIYL